MEIIDSIDIGLPDKKASKLILGTSILNNCKDCSLILNTAIDYGINTFDLAPSFMSNDYVKKWLSTLSTKDPETFKKLVLIAKGGFPKETKTGHYTSKLKGTPSEIGKNLEDDLTRCLSFLNLPKIDMFMLHRDDEDYAYNQIIKRPKVLVNSVFQALQEKKLGALWSSYGISNWDETRTEELVALQKSKICLSSYFSLWERNKPAWSGEYQVTHANLMNKDYLPNCFNLTYSPLGGYYGAKICLMGYDAACKSSYSEMLEVSNKPSLDAIFTEENKKRFERVKELTEKVNNERYTSYTPSQMVLAYAFAHPRADGCILAVKSVAELESDIQGYQLSKTLSPADLDFLHNVS